MEARYKPVSVRQPTDYPPPTKILLQYSNIPPFYIYQHLLPVLIHVVATTAKNSVAFHQAGMIVKRFLPRDSHHFLLRFFSDHRHWFRLPSSRQDRPPPVSQASRFWSRKPMDMTFSPAFLTGRMASFLICTLASSILSIFLCWDHECPCPEARRVCLRTSAKRQGSLPPCSFRLCLCLTAL